MTDKINLCFSCGQIKRPELYLTSVEKMELDRLLSNGDWRAWAKKVLEHSEPSKLAARKLLNDALEGNISPEDIKKRSAEISTMPEDD